MLTRGRKRRREQTSKRKRRREQTPKQARPEARPKQVAESLAGAVLGEAVGPVQLRFFADYTGEESRVELTSCDPGLGKVLDDLDQTDWSIPNKRKPTKLTRNLDGTYSWVYPKMTARKSSKRRKRPPAKT